MWLINRAQSNESTIGNGQVPAKLAKVFQEADIHLNGVRPWDIRVKSTQFYRRVLLEGSLGLGESYMDEQWDAEQLEETLRRLIKRTFGSKPGIIDRLPYLNALLKYTFTNPWSRARAEQSSKQHYEIGADLFEAMLDPTMSYSCAYWKEADTLEAAQLAKLELICRKLELRPGQTLLDIGCGWGGMARYAAERHEVNVLGITNSREQVDSARGRCSGLPVRIELMDYRDITGQYDRIVSIGMFEHVGVRNYREFFNIAHRLLADDGLFLLHTIGTAQTSELPDLWFDKYIFPGGKLPSAKQITAAFEPYFALEDWQCFGADYDRTLMSWFNNFNKAWPSLKSRYDARFYRMWKYYLLFCVGLFRSNYGNLWQLVLAKPERQRGYRAKC